jgi:hypothetical protein
LTGLFKIFKLIFGSLFRIVKLIFGTATTLVLRPVCGSAQGAEDVEYEAGHDDYSTTNDNYDVDMYDNGYESGTDSDYDQESESESDCDYDSDHYESEDECCYVPSYIQISALRRSARLACLGRVDYRGY